MSRVRFCIKNVLQNLLESDVTRHADRAVDQSKFIIPTNVDVSENDSIQYIQDMVNINGLVGVWTMEQHVKDESGGAHDGTASNITYSDAQWNGKDAVFTATDSSKITITDHADFNFDGEFDIFIWFKIPDSATTRTLLSKRTTGTNGFAIQINSTGNIVVDIAASTLTSSTADWDDNAWHLCRVYRNSSDEVRLEIDDTLEAGPTTVATDLTQATDLLFGADNIGAGDTDFLSGDIDITRIYKNINRKTEEATKIFTKRNPRTITKFNGFATKITKGTNKKIVVAQSVGKSIAEIEVRGEIYTNQTPEYIMSDLITNNTDLTPHEHGIPSGITLEKYIADGKLIDIMKDLSQLAFKSFHTDGVNQFHIHDDRFQITNITATHGVNSVVHISEFDDTEIVNDLLVLGENKRYVTAETFDGDASTKVFNLAEAAVSIRVDVDGTVKTAEVDYTVDVLGKTLTFEVAPASGTDNILVEYEFEKPLYIRGEKPSSITQFGKHAKRLIMPWITTRADGVRFVNAYLNKFKDVRPKVIVEAPGLGNGIEEGDVLLVVNPKKSINKTFIVKSIRFQYPKGLTVLDMGEFVFDDFEYQKQIAEKIHDLESAVTTVKEITGYEGMEEILALSDTVIVVDTSGTQDLTDHTTEMVEPLGMTDTINITEIFTAKYNDSNSKYNSDDAYGGV